MTYKTAFITGAAGGIGSALARRLARAGVEVALSDRRLEPVESLAESIRAEGGKVRVYLLDVTEPETVRRTLEEADDQMGGLELVIANAGTNTECWSGDLAWEDYRRGAAVNMDGAVATLLAVLPRLCARKRGHLVGMSSLAQYRGLPGNAMYCATKAFLSTFLESLRADLRGVGIAVTDVRPGFVDTKMTAEATGPHPFLVKPERAAEIIVGGIAKRSAVVAFPWQLAAITRCGVALPARVYDRIVNSARDR
ncbi:MAG TPA: SDR family NAD(P)-dependent oxidoreductase [Kofleriaceae bacterium]|jgi:short-subunit dehydrogenase